MHYFGINGMLICGHSNLRIDILHPLHVQRNQRRTIINRDATIKIKHKEHLYVLSKTLYVAEIHRNQQNMQQHSNKKISQ
jgi:hypothetical protein